MSQKLKFVDREGSEFFSTLKKRVDTYFKENNISKNANASMALKSVFFLSLMVLFYSLIISNIFPLSLMLLFAILLGMTKAFIGFNVCHDAIHGSYSASSKVNKSLSLVFNLIGANAYVWSITHNIVHHTYTNIPGHDEDIEVAPGLLRISPEDKINKIQRFQHFYAFFLYSLASLSWVFRKDYVKFFQKRIGNYDDLKHPRKEYFNLFFFKILYYVLFITLPLIVLDATWWQFIIGFVLMHMAEGLVLGLVFQLAHVVEGTDFPFPNQKGNIEDAWAIHQMKTTANFARKSKLACFLCGGLNMQVEHHLFPKICHIHYPAVSEIVKKTAEEFNVPYNEQPTFFSALKSHYLILKKMGRESEEYSEEKVAMAS
jgi:linoleoyl-CoA desaturase